MISATLILETGETFHGQVPEWQQTIQFGEVVFNTGMVGYVECLTDPSYRGQLLAFTYPLIGNYGVPAKEFWESDRIHAAGLIVSELADFYARSTGEKSLLDWCREYKTAVITGIDTRALTKCLRDKGVVAGAIVVGNQFPETFPDINQEHLVKAVSIQKPTEFHPSSGASHHLLPQGEKGNCIITLNLYSSFLGLFNQILNAARRLRAFGDPRFSASQVHIQFHF